MILLFQDNIVSHGTRSGRKQLLAALQPFQTHVAPNDEQPAATPVEVVAIADGSDVGVVDIGAKASPVQMSNDLSAAMETDWEQQDFDPQSLTEVPTSVPEPKPPPLPASTSVPQQRQAAAEERASDRNESMTSYKGQSVDSGRRSERSGMDLMQLLRQSDMFHVRRDQLNLQSEVCCMPNKCTSTTCTVGTIECVHSVYVIQCVAFSHSLLYYYRLLHFPQSTEMLKRLASLIRFLIIAAGDTVSS